MLTDQLAYRESDQMGQKMRKNDIYYCLLFVKYLYLHFSTFKELKNAKKVKRDRPTDLLSRVHATKKKLFGRRSSNWFLDDAPFLSSLHDETIDRLTVLPTSQLARLTAVITHKLMDILKKKHLSKN